MAEGRGFPWRMTALALAGVVVTAGAAAVGAYAGGVRMERHHGHQAAELERPGRGAIALARMSPESRAAVRAAVTQAWRSAEAERAAARAAREAVWRAAQQDPYDAAAMSEAFSALRAADAAVNAKVQEALAAAMIDLTAEERQALVLFASRRFGRGGGGERGAPPEAAPAPTEP